LLVIIIDVLYLSKTAEHLLECHIWVVCKNLKKMFANSFAEKQNVPFMREHKFKEVNRHTSYNRKLMQICNIITAAASKRNNYLDVYSKVQLLVQ
jgi:hypothetical protein